MPKILSDKDFRARDDTSVLARAKEIQGDNARKVAASKAAQEMVKEEEERMRGLKSVARGATGKKPLKKSSTRKK